MRYLLVLLFLTITVNAYAETCAILPRVGAGTDDVELLIAPTALTVSGVTCYCAGDCVSPIAALAFTDRAGNPINLNAALTCATGASNSTWVDTSGSDPDRNLVMGEGLEVSVTNSPGSEDTVTVCVRFN